ncbi:MAG: YqgE/AlgH family protein [Planctomycetota bacterium]
MYDSLAGKLILASPAMDDPNFEHTVILMVEHSEEGALGLVLNRPSYTSVEEVWQQISDEPCPHEHLLLRGGPCPGPLMLLHDQPVHAQVEVCDGVCFTTEEPLVHELLSQQTDALSFFLGYAGWSAGQLETELGQGAWLVTQATRDIVFDPDADDGLWMRVITSIDRSLAMLAMNPSIMPTDPSMN